MNRGRSEGYTISMAATAHKTEEEKKEYFDTKEELELKTTELAKLIKESKHFIAFTGGILLPHL